MALRGRKLSVGLSSGMGHPLRYYCNTQTDTQLRPDQITRIEIFCAGRALVALIPLHCRD
jgi:hypothetical protein